MCNPFKSKSKQKQTTTFQTQQLQSEQAQNTTQLHTEKKQQTSSVNMQQTPVQKHGVFDKQNNVYGIKQSEIRDNYSDERLDAFHENLKLNVSFDQKMTLAEFKEIEKAQKEQEERAKKAQAEKEAQAFKAYKQMMSLIGKYSDLSPTTTKGRKQAAALSKARLAINDYLKDHKNVIPAADQVAERYQLYFSTFCDGNMEQKTGVHIDASTMEPELHTDGLLNVHYADRRADALFAHEPSINDVRQGCLGDCYLLAGVSTLINEHPEKIKECMKDNGDGTVTVRFYQKYINLSPEEQKKYLIDRLDQRLRSLWNQTDNLSSLSDEELMFKFLQTGSSVNTMKALKTMKQPAEDAQMNKYIADQTAAGKTFTEDEKTKLRQYFQKKRTLLTSTLLATKSLEQAETTMKLATYFASQPEIQKEVIAHLRKSLSEPNPNMDELQKETILKLYEYFPESHEIPGLEEKEPALLDTPEFFQLFNEQKNPSGSIPSGTMIPTYVTVTKEVPVNLFGQDTYSEDCLWLQMLEKAYAASGMHLDEKDEDYKKIDEAYKAELKELDNAQLPANEYAQKKKKLDEKKYRKLHSYNAIIGGRSGTFLETLTGETMKNSDFNQSTPEEISKQFHDLNNELRKRLSLDLGEYVLPVTEIIECAAEIIKSKNVIKKEIKKDDGTTETKEFYTKPLCIEDLLETIEHPDPGSFLEESLNDFCMPIQLYFKDKSAKLQNLTVEGLKKILVDAINDVAAVSDKLTIMHRSMSDQYTKRALIEYDRIQNALAQKIPISFGTRRYLPKGIQASGLNGESEQGGMVEGHAYAVIGTSQKDGKYFVRVRNPWGSGEMGYKTIKKPDGTTALVPNKISAKTSGIFDMELNHFLNMISHLDFNSSVPFN